MRVDVLDDVKDLLDQHWRKPHRRLVEQQHLGPAHQRAADRQHLLLAARERATVLVHALFQAREQAEHALHIGADVFLVGAGKRAHLKVLAHAQARKNAPALGRLQHAQVHDLVRGNLVDALAFEHNLTLARRRDARDRAQRGALARAVRADQRDDLALLDGDRDAFERVDIAIVGMNVIQFQKRHIALIYPQISQITQIHRRASASSV